MTRVHHPECQVEVEAWGDREAFECDDAEVWFEDELMLISYFDDEGIVVLEGRPDPDSGWKLSARSRPWQAFLRPMDDSSVDETGNGNSDFVGEINEQGEVAVWRLRLGPAA
jgi:hypothetical protein